MYNYIIYKMVQVNIDQNLWIPFLQQSVGMQVAASARIREFIKDELKKGDINENYKRN